jgi:hypothetical protein
MCEIVGVALIGWLDRNEGEGNFAIAIAIVIAELA